MFFSTRSKLIASFLLVSLVVGGISLFVGWRLLRDDIVGEAIDRMRLDINVVSEMYRNRVKDVEKSLKISTLGLYFVSDLKTQDRTNLAERLKRVATIASLDFAGIVSGDGKTLCRVGAGWSASTEVQSENPITEWVFEHKVPVAGTLVLNREFLLNESPLLADRARIPITSEGGAGSGAAGELADGLAIIAGIPVFESNMLLGVLYGGILLNRSEELVDRIRQTVFLGENYKGRSIGTATIFLEDIRISTNVLETEGRRAIGTRVLPAVKEYVLDNGSRWTGKAFAVRDWYIGSYEPIEDIHGRRVGMLSIGILEEKYLHLEQRILAIFITITLAGVALAIGLGFILANKIIKPVQQLIKASQQVCEGSLKPDIGPISKGEIGLLQNTFMDMVAAIGRRRAASADKIVQSEKQASIGRLAAGVAHEINNPLTGVLTYTHMLLRRKDLLPDVRSDLETIAVATDRVRKIVKGLLDFSRQTQLAPEPTDINRLVSDTVALIVNQALLKGVTIKSNPGENLPLIKLDRSQFQGVLMNSIINALDATEPGGHITIYTAIGLSGEGSGQNGVEITIADTGCGIPPENLSKLFDPFFTTKTVGEGTGLGLSVSLGVVQRHGGHMRIQSEVGKGTRIFIWLPIEQKEAS